MSDPHPPLPPPPPPGVADGPAPAPVRPAQRLSPLTPLLRAPIVVLAVLGGAWDQLLDSEGLQGVGLIVALALVGGLLFGVASWLRTTYWIDERELRVDTGLLSRQSRRIRIDRLQGVDIDQPFVARLFRHAQLRFDVAGGDTEADLAFLPLAEAEEVRSLLLARRRALRAPAADGADGADGAGAAAPGPPEADLVLARLDLRLLAVSTLLTLETVAFVVGGLVTAALVVGSGSVASVGLLLPVVLGAGFSLARQVNANYGHVVSRTPAGLALRRGLLGVSRQTVALARVQGVRISQPLLWRRFGWARLEVSVAGSAAGGESAGLSSVLMPVADLATVGALAREALRGLDPEGVDLVPAPRRARWRAPLSARWAAIGSSEELVVSRRGLLTRRLDAVPTTRVQSLALVQGPWSRRLGLADLEVHSPVGRVGVLGRFRAQGEARELLGQLVTRTRWARRAAAGV